jgi:hypothetical protein
MCIQIDEIKLQIYLSHWTLAFPRKSQLVTFRRLAADAFISILIQSFLLAFQVLMLLLLWRSAPSPTSTLPNEKMSTAMSGVGLGRD